MMIQCFVKGEYDTIFDIAQKPRLISVSKIDSHHAIHTRMLHSHEDLLEILFVRSGRSVYVVDGEQYPIQEGDIIICNAGILHDEVTEKSEDLNTYCITLTNVKIEDLPENFLCEPDVNPCVPCGEYKDMMEQLYASVYELVASDKPGVEEVCDYLARAVLRLAYQIVQERSERSPGKDSGSVALGREIKQYIDTHYDENLDLDVLANMFHLSPTHVSHVFKKTIGYSPIQYMLRRRLGEAQNLLIHTDYSITGIASMVGYDNPSHFTNMFVKNVKMSPGEYRKSYTNRKKK